MSNYSFQQLEKYAYLNLFQSLHFFGILYVSIKKKYLKKEEFDKYINLGDSKDNGGIKCGGAFTDGEYIYFLDDDTISTPELYIFISLHELLHILGKHCIRRNGRDPNLWNVACDHVVNNIIKQLSNGVNFLSLPNQCIHFDKYETSHPNASAEEIYDLLIKDNDIKVTQIDRYVIVNDGTSGDNKTLSGCNDTDLNIDQQDLEKAIEKAHVNASSKWNSDLVVNKGSMPGIAIEMLDKILEIQIPWEVVLENSILYPLQSSAKRTWTQKNIYIRKYKSPGKKRNSALDRNIMIAVIDTSASISNTDLEKFAGVIVNSQSYFDEIRIIQHDTKVSSYEIISKPTKESLMDCVTRISGRGGTSHKDVFDKIEEMYEEEDQISTIIFLTDYFSDVESIYSDYEFIKEIETTWLLNNSHEVELSGCETKVINI